MNKDDIAAKIDHTLLKAYSSMEQIESLCSEAVQNKTASVCIPPCYVKKVKEKYGDLLKICTVIGFPLGYETTAGKIADTRQCLIDGADEIDMVINICEVKNNNYEYVRQEIESLRKETEGHILKVIVETCYLTEEEKIRMCEIVTQCGADFIKTSTGFGTGGAALDDIRLFKEHIGPNVKIKAAGGIRSVEDAVSYIEAGCDRVGASAVIAALNEQA